MKQPNLSRLRIDRVATKKIRTALSKKTRVTITVHLDTDSLNALKTLSSKTGIPYQRLLNIVLTTNVTQQESIQSRLNRLEQELHKIKRRVAAWLPHFLPQLLSPSNACCRKPGALVLKSAVPGWRIASSSAAVVHWLAGLKHGLVVYFPDSRPLLYSMRRR